MNNENIKKALVDKVKYAIIDIDFSFVVIINNSSINKYTSCMVRNL